MLYWSAASRFLSWCRWTWRDLSGRLVYSLRRQYSPVFSTRSSPLSLFFSRSLFFFSSSQAVFTCNWEHKLPSVGACVFVNSWTFKISIFGRLGHVHKLVVRGLQMIGTSKRKAKQLTSYRSISAIIGSRLAWRRRCFLQPQSGCGITVLPPDCMYTLTVSRAQMHPIDSQRFICTTLVFVSLLHFATKQSS